MGSIFDLDHLYRTYFKMALPSVFGLMVSVVYNLADTFFIAQSNDTALIAGVSLCAPVFTALMAFGNIYGQGGSSLISRLLGQDDREGTGRVSSFCFYVALTTGVVLAALMMLFRVPLLGILGATAETMSHAQAYYTVLAIGAPATVLNFIHSNLVRCEGMATQSMIGSIGGTVINIILDPILITTVGWGARGAAIATIVRRRCSTSSAVSTTIRAAISSSTASRRRTFPTPTGTATATTPSALSSRAITSFRTKVC